MRYLPLFADLAGRHCLVIGGTETAARKIRLLLKAGAVPLVLADTVTEEIAAAAHRQELVIENRRFTPNDLMGVSLVVVASDNEEEISAPTAKAISMAARKAGVPVNVVDRPDLCSVIFPGIIDRDPILVAVSSAGHSPVLVRRVREKIEAALPSRIGRLASFAGRFRNAVARAVTVPSGRRAFWEQVLDGPIGSQVLRGDEPAATEAMLRLINTPQPAALTLGSVALVGAGPGDPDLLTLRALRLLQEADVVVHDALISDGILDLLRRDAVRIDVGKRKGVHRSSQANINQLLADQTKSGQRVVRLKGGDPFLFGRGSEEMDFLRARGIEVQIVPGITAALGAAAAGGIPLTHRDHASAVTFVTGHGRGENEGGLNDTVLANLNHTVAVYMGLSVASQVTARAIAAGRAGSTPVVLIDRATHGDQQVLHGTLSNLGDLVERAALSGPALLIIGEVAAVVGLVPVAASLRRAAG
jgi:uroporphyrin-III C-methyltransferase/precorrin-2 dehydrogenase/sirohydrochlorin ferrochelatase